MSNKNKPQPRKASQSDLKQLVDGLYSGDTEFDRAARSVFREFMSGKLYRDQIKAMKSVGLDPEKPITLGFVDGTTAEVRPIDSIKHLKPPTKKGR